MGSIRQEGQKRTLHFLEKQSLWRKHGKVDKLALWEIARKLEWLERRRADTARKFGEIRLRTLKAMEQIECFILNMRNHCKFFVGIWFNCKCNVIVLLKACAIKGIKE